LKKLKPRHKRRFFWIVFSAIAAVAMSFIIIPPFISLNSMKPALENAITQKTGLIAKINGNINFSLLGDTTIVAHNIVLPNGKIDSFRFTIPLSKIFNPESADLSGDLAVYGANISIETFTKPEIDNKIEIKNSVIHFMNNEYKIVQGRLYNGLFNGIVRNNEHKYEFDSDGDKFNISNKNNGLEISGRLYSDGTASGLLSIDTDDANKLFNFSEPKIHKHVKLKSNFDWNGKRGWKFYNIDGGDFTGKIRLFDDGHREITLNSDDINFDISFLLNKNSVFFDTKFNLDLSGNLKLGDRIFKHIKIDAVGEKDVLKINEIIADDIMVSSGEITAEGAKNLGINLKIYNINTYCLFSGDSENWGCNEFRHGDFYGSINVKTNWFELYVKSDKNMPEKNTILKKISQLGENGYINFKFADAAGTIDLNKSIITPHYEFVKNRTLSWLGMDLYFLPKYLNNQTGNFSWTKNDVFFEPNSGKMKLTIGSNYFSINGNDIKDLFTGEDLRFLNNDMAYTVYGNYKGKNISNLKIKIAGHVFTGTAVENNITLKTDLLNLDTFTNQDFVDNFEENQFLTGDPLITPFGLGINLSLSADMIIYNGNQFTNFVYSLKSDSEQDFSITDSMHGNLLANITKNQNKYNIILQLNKFDISDNFLSSVMPLNISDTIITAQAELNTSGKIAYDIWNNLSGDIDISFDGGTLIGMGIDNFYASAENITSLNAEDILSQALDNGKSKIKKMRFIGEYDHGNFISTKPFVISMYRADAAGRMQITDGKMSVNMNLVLRGTSPSPDQINIEILPDGKRVYSLSQIMTNFDSDYLRDFSKTHDRF
ncbi:MAG: hypothetical protein JW974_04025, partial [Alphaproteobacteria bacterium]|nr:hypothetical protein [Alphaproteobacteria bacterium]